MFRDFGQRYVDVSDSVPDEKRLKMLEKLGKTFGGMVWRPATYVVYSSIPLLNEREEAQNYLVLSASTAELRPFFLMPHIFNGYDYIERDSKETKRRVLKRLDERFDMFLRGVGSEEKVHSPEECFYT